MRLRSLVRVLMAWLASGGVAVFGMVRPADAQEDTAAARAESLFREGRAAMRGHEYFEACTKFRESDALDPSPGTRLNWAICDEQVGRIAEALAHARWALSRLGSDDDRRPIALRVAAELEKRVPRLTLRLAPSAGAGAKVYLDGELLELAGGTITRELDPGEHIVFVEQPSHEAGRTALTLHESENAVRNVAPGPEYRRPGDTGAESPVSPGWNGPGPAGHALAGGAGAALVTTIVMGVLALAERNIVDQECHAGLCSPRGFEAADRGRAFVHVGEVSLAVSAASAAGATVLLWPHPPRAGPGKTLPSGVGISIVRRF